MKTTTIEIAGDVSYAELYNAILGSERFVDIHSIRLISEAPEPEKLPASIYATDRSDLFSSPYIIAAGAPNEADYDYDNPLSPSGGLFPDLPSGWKYATEGYATFVYGQWFREVERVKE